MEVKIGPEEIVKMRVVEGSLFDPSVIDKFPNKVLENLGDDNWGNLIEVTMPFGAVKELQQKMVKHYEGPTPWYTDGRLQSNPEVVICAFGADDGEEGRIFVFNQGDKWSFQTVCDYGISKGIPKEQMDFLD